MFFFLIQLQNLSTSLAEPDGLWKTLSPLYRDPDLEKEHAFMKNGRFSHTVM